jgi:spore coat protein U-like protein
MKESMAMTTSTHPTGLPPLRWLALLLWLLLQASPALAQCILSPLGGGIGFGIYTTGSTKLAQGSVPYACVAQLQRPVYYRMCLYISAALAATSTPGSPPMENINPRYMYGRGPNPPTLRYDLYSDPARTQILGPEGSAYPVYSFTFRTEPGRGSQSAVVPIYGRIPAGQDAIGGQNYESNPGLYPQNRLYWSSSTTGFPEACRTATTQSPSFSSLMTTARMSSECRLVSATDLDFGTLDTLKRDRDSSASISLRCPRGTSWRMTLSNGSNSVGGKRFMKNESGQSLLEYRLFKNGYLEPWDENSALAQLGTGETNLTTVKVFGRLPARASMVPAGNYSDTVVVQLTY